MYGVRHSAEADGNKQPSIVKKMDTKPQRNGDELDMELLNETERV